MLGKYLSLSYIWCSPYSLFAPSDVRLNEVRVIMMSLVSRVTGVVAGCLVLLLAAALSSCSENSSPTSAASQSRAHGFYTDTQMAPDTLTINNQSSHNVDSVSALVDGNRIMFPAQSGTDIPYLIPDNPSMVYVEGIALINGGHPMPIVLPDGSKVYAMWKDDIIVIVDTIEMN